MPRLLSSSAGDWLMRKSSLLRVFQFAIAITLLLTALPSFAATRIDLKSNQLAVEIDNRPGAATIPGFAQRLGENTWYDWWHYGGIVRDVWLTENEPVLVRRQKIRSHVDGGSAQTSDVVFLENTGKSDKAVQVRVFASIDGQDAPVAQQTIPLTLKPGASQAE